MKLNKILIVLGAASLLLTSCDRDLPYPLDDVTRGVLIDVTKTSKTDQTFSEGTTSGNYGLTLQIPWQQGDYSHMKEAQLLCVFTPVSGGSVKSAVVQEGINVFPVNVQLNLADICSKLGITYPSIGDKFEFTTNVILNGGTVIPGWTKEMGFNNRSFTGWDVDGRSYSFRASYSAYAPFLPEVYQGPAICDEDGGEYPVVVTPLPAGEVPSNLPGGLTADDVYGMLIENIWDTGGKLKVWFNKTDFTLIIPDQTIIEAWTYGSYGTYPFLFKTALNGEADTSNSALKFTVSTSWGPYTFGSPNYIIKFPAK